jgi:serine/threonine-protein kinase
MLDDDALTRSARQRIGQVLCGKWRLDRLIGLGGMAAVYEGTHRNGKQVAIKILHAGLCRHDEVRARFLSEGYAANSVKHAGVVSVLDDDETEDGAAFLVMDLLEGETLEARWQRCDRRLPLPEVLAIGTHLLDVLAAAHAAGIVHRDVKPANVFVTNDGAVKVLDFGIARVRELSSRTSRTQVGATMGTPGFMPPEQARGRWDEVDERSDVWAVGAILFALASGRDVHAGTTDNEVLLSAMTARAPSLATALPEAPSPIVAVVDRALAFDKQDRWPSASSMLEAVRAAIGALPVDAASSEVASMPEPAPETPKGATRLAAARSIGDPLAAARPRGRTRAPIVAAGAALLVVTSVATGVVFRTKAGTGPSSATDRYPEAAAAVPADAASAPLMPALAAPAALAPLPQETSGTNLAASSSATPPRAGAVPSSPLLRRPTSAPPSQADPLEHRR